jgi:hypothetical protein
MEERKRVVEQIKMQAVIHNFGLPENGEIIGLGAMTAKEACKELKAVRELWVRLDLYVTTGESSKGSIDFPEAKRRIEYNLVGKRPANSTVRFKALVSEKRNQRRY